MPPDILAPYREGFAKDSNNFRLFPIFQNTIIEFDGNASSHSMPERMLPYMKEQYLAEIVKLLEQCNDVSLLDLIHQLLLKSQSHLLDG